MDRPSVQRELIPYGSAASANLLNAFDLRLQERTADPDAIAALARLMRAGDVLVQSDLQYERYNTPRPRNFWALITSAPGLGEPVPFGPGEPNETIADVQLDDELLLQTDPDLPHPHELAVLPVSDPVPIVSTTRSARCCWWRATVPAWSRRPAPGSSTAASSSATPRRWAQASSAPRSTTAPSCC